MVAPALVRRSRPLLGCFVEIGLEYLHAGEQQDNAVNAAISAAFACISEIENTLSFHNTSSELSQLNRAQGKWTPMSAHSVKVLRLARYLGLRSSNTFNCTVGGDLVAKGVLPVGDNRDFIGSGDSGDIELRADAARLKRPVLISLDGIAKGYAVDLAVQSLQRSSRENGVTLSGGWVNAGGDLRVFGDSRLQVQLRGSAAASNSLSLHNIALASSRLSSKIDSNFPALIIKKQPPHSVQSGPLLPDEQAIISICAASAWRADALTKVVAGLDPTYWQAELRRFGGWIATAQTA